MMIIIIIIIITTTTTICTGAMTFVFPPRRHFLFYPYPFNYAVQFIYQ